MLSDRERETLDGMERALLREDPKLVRRFERTDKSPAICYDGVLALALGLSLLLSAFAVLVGAVGEACGFATLAGSLAAVRYWLRLSRRSNGGTSEERSPDH